MFTMVQNQLVDALSERREQFVIWNVHSAQDRVIAARSANLVGNSDIYGEVAHPVRFRDGKDIWMQTQAPGKNACPGSRRSYYKNRAFGSTLHLAAFSSASQSCCQIESINSGLSAHPEAASSWPRQTWKRSFNFVL